ncbi:replication initiation protein [Streptomyces sp. NBC_01594]
MTLVDMLRVANSPRFERWKEQVRRTGGCAQPIHLSGHSQTVDTRTGEFFEYSTSSEPGGRLRIACGNRRASRCPSCAWTYAGDTYHLIMAGLVGGKGIPDTVAERPRVFATLTAPSFGPVHNRPDSGRCRCGTTHAEDDPALGTAIHPDRYDYAGAVLWNNHAGALWQRFTIYLRREVAARAGLTQAACKEEARVSFGKVAEFQKRGAVHFHAVIRIDGPDGPDTPHLPDHTRRLIEACWDLDTDYPERLLAHWSHMLGFRGHFSTKTPRYSTTLGALRGARADWRAQQERRERGLDPLDQDDDTTEDTTLVIAHWEYAGQGHTPGESWLAQSIANEIRQNRELARENRTELEAFDTVGEW